MIHTAAIGLANGPAKAAANGPATRTIHLYGSLRANFRPSYKLAVRTPAEAVRALSAMVPGFKRAIMDGSFRCIAGRRSAPRHLDANTVQNPWQSNENDFHLVPAIAGRSKGSVTKIIIGVVLIVAAIAAPYALGIAGGGLFGFAGATIGGTGISFGTIAAVGVLAVLGGIAQSISPQPQGGQNGETQSFLATNLINTVKQGNPVPLIYGETMVGSQVISMGIKPYDISPGTYTQNNGTSAAGSGDGGQIGNPANWNPL